MKKYRIDEITDNLDNLRKPLNSIERSKIPSKLCEHIVDICEEGLNE